MSKREQEVEWGTWRSEPCFKGSSYLSGTGASFIVVEVMRGSDLPVCTDGGFLSFDFRVGTTEKDMLELINLMNERISHIGYTGKPPSTPVQLDDKDVGGKVVRLKQ